MPKKDQCALCAIIRNKFNPRDVREAFKDKWTKHIRAKQAVKKIKTKDRSEGGVSQSKIAVCSFDLQKQLNLPH